MTFVALLASIGWLICVVWQLRLSRIKGKVRTRNGYILRADNPAMFELCVLVYWVHLVLGVAILVGLLILTSTQILN
jgi:hypothetical protein